jgi:hypothetical protein
MRDPYHCPYCHHSSTRRWNLDVHIRRKHGGTPGRYLASNHSYNRNIQSHQFGSAIVVDNSIDNSFQPRYISQQTPLAGSGYPSENHVIADTANSFWPENSQRHFPPAVPPYPQTPAVHQLRRLEELRLLLGKFSSPQNAYTILELAKFNLRQGDERFLNERLEQFRMLDRQS